MRYCVDCGFYDEDYGCICPSQDKWYACPLENIKQGNIQALKEYIEWVEQHDEIHVNNEKST